VRFAEAIRKMTRVSIDSSTLSKLQHAKDVVEVCDEAGKIMGYFYPFVEPPRDADGKLICPYTDEEIESLSQQKGGRPLSDILNDLSRL
jgi:hypothetical protein